MALGLADLLGTSRQWFMKGVAVCSLAPGGGYCCCHVWSVQFLCTHTAVPTGWCWVAPFESLLLPIPRKGSEDIIGNQNTLQTFWPGAGFP